MAIMVFLSKILISFIYSNLMEYAIHRWILHGWLWKQHEPHHADATSTVFFVNSKRGVIRAVGLITSSSLLWGVLIGWGWLPLIFFLVYYFLLLEGAHFLIHEYHWRGHHMEHHAEREEGNWNVWIPLGDILFRTRIK
jgi:hypothetical protein